MRQLFRLIVLTVALLSVLSALGCGRATSRELTPAGALQGPSNSAFLAQSEIVVGVNRFTFVLADAHGTHVEKPLVKVRFYTIQSASTGVFQGEAEARFQKLEVQSPHVHEGGEVHLHQEIRGFYLAAPVLFPSPGFWGAEFVVPASDGEKTFATAAFQVVAQGTTPPIGAPVPATRNLTARDVSDLAEISSRTPPDPLLYQRSIAGALEEHIPFVVVFATPAFCRSAVCGPVVELVLSVASSYGDRVAFIHIEPYDLHIARKEGRLELVEATKQWGLPSEPYVFVVDPQGRLAAKFEGLFTADELKKVLDGLASQGKGSGG